MYPSLPGSPKREIPAGRGRWPQVLSPPECHVRLALTLSLVSTRNRMQAENGSKPEIEPLFCW